MKPFNIISALLFGILACVCLWAAFHNPFHFLTAGASALMTALALTDDTYGESIIQHITKKRQ